MAQGALTGKMRLVAGLVLAFAAAATLLGLRGCDETTAGDTALVRIAGKPFHLELALDGKTRFEGLSGRTHIEPDGGKLFVFPRPMETGFVMRDCPIPIDVLYVDQTGRIVAMHEMQPEPPRTEEEKKLSPPDGFPNAPQWQWTNDAYERRLKQYPSRYATQFVIELRGGTYRTLGVKEGDKVELDMDGLKRRAQ
jgi:uncharacterized membrane protein (UPF0127 family)